MMKGILRGAIAACLGGMCVAGVTAATLEGGATEPTEATNASARWRYQRFDPSAPPAALSRAATEALAAVEGFTSTQNYRVDVSDCGRVLLVTDAAQRSVHSAEAAARRALEAFDERFPNAGPGEVIVLGRMRSDADAALLRAQFAMPENQTGATPARVVAWRELSLREAPGRDARRIEEGRLARAIVTELLADRYGELPAWFTRGAALHIEASATGRLASVDPAANPRAWRADLRRAFAQPEAPLHIDLAALGWLPECRETPRGEGVVDWALVDSLVEALSAEDAPGGLGPIAADLATRLAEADDSPGAGAGPEAQRRVLEDHAGGDVLSRIEGRLATGRPMQ